MKKSGFIYLASPYTDPSNNIMHQRYLAACKACGHLAGQNEIVYSPIVHWHNVAQMYQLPKDFEFWKTQDHSMIKLCSKVVVLCIDGWKDSKGVQSEIKFAQTLGKEIVYWKGSQHG